MTKQDSQASGTRVPFVATIAVRFRDFDMFGHVNHAEYLAYCEEHRTSFFELWEHECGNQPLDAGFVVAQVHGQFLAPLDRRARSVEVHMSVAQVGRTSAQLQYRILDCDTVCAEIEYTLVMVGPDRRPRPVDDGERALLMRFAQMT